VLVGVGSAAGSNLRYWGGSTLAHLVFGKRWPVLTATPARKLFIYVESNEQWHGRPLYSAIVQRCREARDAGATVVSCEEGYGSHHVLHTSWLFSLSEDLPVRVEIVEAADRLDRVLEALQGMLGKGLVVVYDVQVLKETPDPP
jgi:PII-like signaling protein